jgi:hypothetical protein
MEPRFGHGFSHVRVHDGAKAAESARSVNALAYTVGSNIVFDARQFAPCSAGGEKLLAHELTHVIQQGSANTMPVLRLGPTEDSAEREANRLETTIGREGLSRQVADIQYPVPIGTLQRRPARDESVPRKHKVKKRETLTQIAAAFGVSVQELKKANTKKLKKWPAKNDPKRSPHFVWGFNADEEIIIPPTQESPNAKPQDTGTDPTLGAPGEVKKAGVGEENVPPKTISFKPQPTNLFEGAIGRILANNRQLSRSMLGLVLKPESKPESKKETTEFSTGSELQMGGETSPIIFFSLSIPITDWKLKKLPFPGDLKFFDKLEVQVSGGLKRGDNNQPRWFYPIAGEAAVNMIHYERQIIENWLKLELSVTGKISGDYLEQTKEGSAAGGGALGAGIEFTPGKDSPWAVYLQGTGEVMWDAKTINWKDLSAKPVWGSGLNVGISRKF